jgi:hypothetical protein
VAAAVVVVVVVVVAAAAVRARVRDPERTVLAQMGVSRAVAIISRGTAQAVVGVVGMVEVVRRAAFATLVINPAITQVRARVAAVVGVVRMVGVGLDSATSASKRDIGRTRALVLAAAAVAAAAVVVVVVVVAAAAVRARVLDPERAVIVAAAAAVAACGGPSVLSVAMMDTGRRIAHRAAARSVDAGGAAASWACAFAPCLRRSGTDYFALQQRRVHTHTHAHTHTHTHTHTHARSCFEASSNMM